MQWRGSGSPHRDLGDIPVRPAVAHRRVLPGPQVGCKVEELQHHTAERLERAMAIKMVVGWRIQLMVQLDLPGDLLFSA